MLRNFLAVVLVLAGVLLGVSETKAQSLTGQLSALLTEQRPSPASFAPDPPAAAATRDTVAGLFLIELVFRRSPPRLGGFIYRLNPTLGVVERASGGFGPFFTERTLQNRTRSGLDRYQPTILEVQLIAGSEPPRRHLSDQRRPAHRRDPALQRRHAAAHARGVHDNVVREPRGDRSPGSRRWRFPSRAFRSPVSAMRTLNGATTPPVGTERIGDRPRRYRDKRSLHVERQRRPRRVRRRGPAAADRAARRTCSARDAPVPARSRSDRGRRDSWRCTSTAALEWAAPRVRSSGTWPPPSPPAARVTIVGEVMGRHLFATEPRAGCVSGEPSGRRCGNHALAGCRSGRRYHVHRHRRQMEPRQKLASEHEPVDSRDRRRALRARVTPAISIGYAFER